VGVGFERYVLEVFWAIDLLEIMNDDMLRTQNTSCPRNLYVEVSLQQRKIAGVCPPSGEGRKFQISFFLAGR
jgi:hypothetical protein